MKMYHGTTYKAWKDIKKEGILWGRKNKYWCGNKMNRVTYLAKNKEDALKFGSEVLLEINMPNIICCENWEYVIYEPISVSNIVRIL